MDLFEPKVIRVSLQLLAVWIGSAKTDLVRFKWGFGEGPLEDKFAFFGASKNPRPRGENCLQNAHFHTQKGPCLKHPLNWTGSVFPLLNGAARAASARNEVKSIGGGAARRKTHTHTHGILMQTSQCGQVGRRGQGEDKGKTGKVWKQ